MAEPGQGVTISKHVDFQKTGSVRELVRKFSQVSELEATINKIQRTQSRFFIQVSSSNEIRIDNAIWMSQEDFKALYGSQDTEIPRLFEVANHVYKVCSAVLPPGWIGVSDAIYQEMQDEVCHSDKNILCVVGSPRVVSKEDTYPISEMFVRFDDQYINRNYKEKFVLFIEEVEQKIRDVLKGEILSKNEDYRSFSLQFPWGLMKASIKEQFADGSSHSHGGSYGVIDENTKLKLVSNVSNKFVVIDEIIPDDQVSEYFFTLSLEKRCNSANDAKLPLALSRDVVVQEIMTQVSQLQMTKGVKLTHQLNNSWNLSIFFTGVTHKLEYRASDEKKGFNDQEYQKAYLLEGEDKIRFKGVKPKEIRLIEGSPQLADIVHFKITDMPGGQSQNGIDHDKERWICLEELANEIRKNAPTIVFGQMFELSLSSGVFFIEATRVTPKEKNSKQLKDLEKFSWDISQASFMVEAEGLLGINLVENHTIYPLRFASIQISGAFLPIEGLEITEAQLKELLITKGPEKHVFNQIFEVFTPCGVKLICKVTNQVFYSDAAFSRGTTGFGQFTEETKFEFQPLETSAITLIEKVYQEEIEKLQFMLGFVKNDGNVIIRKPIVVDEDKLREAIIEELSYYEYITDSFTFTFPHCPGIDIGVVFKKGVLHGVSPEEKPQEHYSNKLSKIGYAFTEGKEIEFEAKPSEIVLASGPPGLASRVEYKVLKRFYNDHLNNNSSLTEGSWICLEEFKAAVQKLRGDFVQWSVFELELRSGKYLFEVCGGTPVDSEAVLEENLEKTRWMIDENSQANLIAGKLSDISIINTSEEYPLKSLELTISPIERVIESTSIHEDDFKNSLSRTLSIRSKKKLSQRLIEGGVFTLVTDKNFKVKIEITKMTLEEKHYDVKAAQVFGKITPETELTFKAAKGSKYAVVVTPKILKVTDPVAFWEEQGIGGIDEAAEIIHRSLLSRVEKLDAVKIVRQIDPTKGILFYGPPGTGKTVIARIILEELLGISGDQLKILTSTEVFNMWFGKSEEAIRNLFETARLSKEPVGIFIDEIDALLRQRGNDPGGKTRESLVNQFLASMDGALKNDNVFLVGATNRKDVIDEAALREGRISKHIEIGLPDQRGRLKIFNIHTKHLRTAGLLKEDVNLEYLAERTIKYSGADIKGLVTEARRYGDARLCFLDCPKEELATHEAGIVTMDDFKNALHERETVNYSLVKRRCKAGIKEIDLFVQTTQKYFDIENPVSHFEKVGIGGIEGPLEKISRLFVRGSDRLKEEVKRREIHPIGEMLFSGPSGTGKLKIAKQIASMLGCTDDQIKVITPKEILKAYEEDSNTFVPALIKPSEGRSSKIDKLPLKVIIIDKMESMASDGSLQSLKSLIAVCTFIEEVRWYTQTKNYLLIGVTNDESVIGPGSPLNESFEELVRFDFPNTDERRKIFDIHMKKHQELGILDESVRTQELAGVTRGYVGADIKTVVQKAREFSEVRPNAKITKEDFENAIDQVEKTIRRLAINRQKGEIRDEDRITQTTQEFFDVSDPLKHLREKRLVGMDKPIERICQILAAGSDKLRGKAKPINEMLFYGPPAVGKFALAEELGKMLKCTPERIKVITPKDIYGAYEKNAYTFVYDLVKPSRNHSETANVKYPLHLIVMKDLDSLLTKDPRHIQTSEEEVVEKFLNELKWYVQTRNYLVIGIASHRLPFTRKELLNGRFTESVKFELPDNKARIEMIKIHADALDKSVNLENLADRTLDYSGAEMKALVEQAQKYANRRFQQSNDGNRAIKMEDFEEAFNQRKLDDGAIYEAMRSIYH